MPSAFRSPVLRSFTVSRAFTRTFALALVLPLALTGWAGAPAGAASGVGVGAGVSGELYVICNAAVTLRPSEIRDTFVGEKGFVGSLTLAPADNSAAQATFLERVLKVDASKYASIWTKKAFRDGVNPPPMKSNDAEALAYVKQTRGGCSYVATAPGPGVAVIARF